MQNKSVGELFVESGVYQEVQERKSLPSARFEFASWHESKALTTDPASGGAAVQPYRLPGISYPADRPLTIRDLLSSVPVTSSPVEDVRETGFTRNVAAVPEGTDKPESSITFEKVEVPIRVIATTLTASRQILSDAPQMRQHIDTRLRYAVLEEEEDQLIYGNGLGENLEGFLVNADRQTYSWSSGATLPVPDNKIDALRRAATLVTLANYPATGAIVHPSDREDIDLAKGEDGHYLILSSAGGGVLRLPIVESNALVAGQAAVGAFALAAVIYDREQATVQLFEQHADYAKKNLVLVRAEERIGLGVSRPEAVVHVTFDSAPV